MRIYGIDFTSRPRRGKPITCAACTLKDYRLAVDELLLWTDFAGFEKALCRPGPWVAGIDLPFGQSRRLIQDLGWPATWDGYVAHAAGVTIPGLQAGDLDRIVVEAYPGVMARALIGRRSYKQDTTAKQTAEQAEARRDILRALDGPAFANAYGITVAAPSDLAEDRCGDRLDALLCAIQAAWAWIRRHQGFGLPEDVDPLEGWIADPHVRAS